MKKLAKVNNKNYIKMKLIKERKMLISYFLTKQGNFKKLFSSKLYPMQGYENCTGVY